MDSLINKVAMNIMIQFYIFGALLLIALALVVLVAKKQS